MKLENTCPDCYKKMLGKDLEQPLIAALTSMGLIFDIGRSLARDQKISAAELEIYAKVNIEITKELLRIIKEQNERQQMV